MTSSDNEQIIRHAYPDIHRELLGFVEPGGLES